MPAKSRAQERYFQIAEHHPELLRGPVPKMSKAAMHDFASGSEKGKPQHVKKPKALARVGPPNQFSAGPRR